MTDAMIVDAISSVSVNRVGNSPQAAAVSAPQQVASPDAVARFQAAMGPEAVAEAGKVQSVPLASEVAATWRSAQQEHQVLLHRIKSLVEFSTMNGLSQADLQMLQYDVATLSFQQDVVVKVADKASNAIQTLIKNQ